MINEAKEELETTLRHNYAIREEERFRMAQNTITISSESSSSGDFLETSSVESSEDVLNESSEDKDSDEILKNSVPYRNVFNSSLHTYGHVLLPPIESIRRNVFSKVFLSLIYHSYHIRNL